MYVTCRTSTGASALRARLGPHPHVVSPQQRRGAVVD